MRWWRGGGIYDLKNNNRQSCSFSFVAKWLDKIGERFFTKNPLVLGRMDSPFSSTLRGVNNEHMIHIEWGWFDREELREETTNKRPDGTFRAQVTVGNRRQAQTQFHSSNSGNVRVGCGIPTTQKISGHGWLELDYLGSKASFHRLKSNRGLHSPFLGHGLT